MKSAQIRQKFLSYFEERGHAIVPSSSLVPAQDPTLLFTNAGMVPFKDVFLGIERRPYTRAASVQKCLRVSGKHNDLEEVGPSPQHHTFFEMLGNFSFGDYFKEEAIAFAWELLTKGFGLPADVLHPTVFEEDDESAALWSRVKGLPASEVVRLGAEHNFWSMGDTGPCGPNSEIIYDRTGRCLKDGSDCHLTCECGRWWELWNLVFMQFDRAADGTLTPLAQQGVDTGMGFERLCAILQGVPSNYETDLFLPIFETITALTRISYSNASDQQRIAMRVLSDHIRAVTFLIADGVMPSNGGRGYVLRKIIRRAVFFAKKNFVSNRGYLAPLADAVINSMSEAYPELRNRQAIASVVKDEEERFTTTLNKGDSVLRDLAEFASSFKKNLRDAISIPRSPTGRVEPLEALGLYGDEPIKIPGSHRPVLEAVLRPYRELLGPTYPFKRPENLQAAIELPFEITGEAAFLLWDTYGFPPDLTERAAADYGLSIASGVRREFEMLMEEQRERGRAARGAEKERDETLLAYTRDLAPTRFVGYEAMAEDAQLLLLFSEGLAGLLPAGYEIDIVLDVTPFYAEGGGQVGDCGRIVGPNGEAEIDTVRRVGGVFVHSGRITRGELRLGDSVRAEVDETARRATMRNHTATHLLHRALRVVLGPQAKQAGSLVAPERLRFDFLHNKPLTDEELREVERIVREQVLLDRPVRTEVLPIQQALELGADAMFDEKYGQEARVVTVGDGEALRPGSEPALSEAKGQAFSRELCGGTHCRATGEIGAFLIVDQRSVGAGVRRVDALTGTGAFAWLDTRRQVVEQLSREYNVPPEELLERLRALSATGGQARELPRPAASNLPDPDDVLARAEKRDSTYLVVDWIDNADATTLREFGDELRRRAKSAAVVLGSVFEGKLNFVVMLTPDLVEKGLHAGHLAQRIGRELGGGGGGRPDVATAGGRDPARLEGALALARALLRGQG